MSEEPRGFAKNFYLVTVTILGLVPLPFLSVGLIMVGAMACDAGCSHPNLIFALFVALILSIPLGVGLAWLARKKSLATIIVHSLAPISINIALIAIAFMAG